jgi:hypothetical protein
VHLITLRDPFVGYVLPSKVHACIESGKRILFVGSPKSDVHLLASALPSDKYHRVNVGDVEALVNVLHAMEHAVVSERKMGPPLEPAIVSGDFRPGTYAACGSMQA